MVGAMALAMVTGGAEEVLRMPPEAAAMGAAVTVYHQTPLLSLSQSPRRANQVYHRSTQLTPAIELTVGADPLVAVVVARPLVEASAAILLTSLSLTLLARPNEQPTQGKGILGVPSARRETVKSNQPTAPLATASVMVGHLTATLGCAGARMPMMGYGMNGDRTRIDHLTFPWQCGAESRES